MMSVFVCLFGQCCSHRKMTVNCILFCVNNISFYQSVVFFFFLPAPAMLQVWAWMSCRLQTAPHLPILFSNTTSSAKHHCLGKVEKNQSLRGADFGKSEPHGPLHHCCICLRGPPLLFPTLSSLCHLLCEIERQMFSVTLLISGNVKAVRREALGKASERVCRGWMPCVWFCLVLNQTASLYG